MNIRTREELKVKETWNLACLYNSWDTWQQELGKLEAKIPNISSFAETLGQSAENLANALSCVLSIRRQAETLYTFARLSSDVNTADSKPLGHLQTALRIMTRVSAESSYIKPEILSVSPEVFDDLLKNPILAQYKRLLTEIRRYRPHVLSKESEQLLAMGSEVFSSIEKVFSQLHNADLIFEHVEVKGEKKPLSHGTFSLFMRDTNRGTRESAYNLYYKTFDQHRNTIAATLASAVQRDVYLARVRHHSSALEHALFSDNIQTCVYNNLIDTVSNNLGPLHHYYAIRKKVLKLSHQRTFDTYVPLVTDSDVTHSYEEAVKTVLDSLKPLGTHYLEVLSQGLTTDRWVDRYENKGKLSGAYSGGCFDSLPYILLNYNDTDIRQLFTLTHEAGHSMHSYFSRKHQNYHDSSYTIFVAEVASTLNEQLLVTHLRNLYADNTARKAFLLTQQIDDIKATFYRQTMFAEFEKTIHERVESNKSLTIEDFRCIYGELLKKYFGAAVELSETDELECLRIPHFYRGFYVYKYATGLSAAIALTEKVLHGGQGELESYLNFLSTGCSKYPLDLLRDAGVDMSTPESIEATCRLFTNLVSELDSTLTN